MLLHGVRELQAACSRGFFAMNENASVQETERAAGTDFLHARINQDNETGASTAACIRVSLPNRTDTCT